MVYVYTYIDMYKAKCLDLHIMPPLLQTPPSILSAQMKTPIQ